MLITACFLGANAQQDSSTEDVSKPFYKFYKGSVATELNFSLFNINISDDGVSTNAFSMPELRLRFGLSNKWALRLNLGIDFGHNNIKRNLDNENEGNWTKIITTGERIEKSSYTKFSIAPGFEYHFGNWNRLSIYVGGEIPFGIYVTKSVIDEDRTIEVYERNWYNDNNFELIRATRAVSYMETKNAASAYICDDWGCYYTYRQAGNMFFGIKAFAGFDFYVYKGLYLGAELGLGYNHSLALKGSVTGNSTIVTITPTGSDTKMTEIDEKFEDKIMRGHLGFKCNPMIRLGWRF